MTRVTVEGFHNLKTCTQFDPHVSSLLGESDVDFRMRKLRREGELRQVYSSFSCDVSFQFPYKLRFELQLYPSCFDFGLYSSPVNKIQISDC